MNDGLARGQRSIVKGMPQALAVRSAPDTVNDLVSLLRFRALDSDSLGLIYLTDGESAEIQHTYADMDRRARCIAAALQRMTTPGDRALLLFEPGIDIIAAYFGAWYAGLTTVPVAPPLSASSADDLVAVLRDAQPRVLLTSRLLSTHLASLISRLPNVATLVVSDVEANEDEWIPYTPSPDDLASLMYTSGSTSRPKGVMKSHGHIVNGFRLLTEFGREVNVPGPVVTWTPLHHVMGFGTSVLAPLFSGDLSVVLPPQAFIEKPVRWLQAIARYRAVASASPNFGYQQCVDKVTSTEREGLDLSCWRLAVTGSENIRIETLEAFLETYAPFGFPSDAFRTSYGASESSVSFDVVQEERKPRVLSINRTVLELDRVVLADTADADAFRLVSCGTPMLGQEVRIVDPVTLLPLEQGQVGEIWTRGAHVAQGYWNQPEETKRTFEAYLPTTQEGPFLRTGDLGFMYTGELYITGRLKEMIIVNGKNHYAVDLEQTSERAHEAIIAGASAAFAVTINGEERLVLVHEVKESTEELPVDEIAEAVRRAIGVGHGLSVHDVVLAEAGSIPRTSNGKIRRLACRDAYLSLQST